ncbi:hypothetical protein F4776DRAFT_539319 [Hypoxylon sp. NC0597]|nr:hypothetical protein F4776DRAFT_539319 [Hypoxylon sp. NC0597]
MCFCNDDDYHPRDGRHPPNSERDRRQVAAQGYGWPGQTTTRSNNPQQSLRRQDSFIEPGLAHALVGLPDSDFRAVYDPERARQQRVPASQPILSPNYPQQLQRGAPGIIAEQPSTIEAMAVAYPQGVRQIVHQHPSVSTSSKTAPSMPSPVRLMRRDSNGVSECSDDEYDEAALRNYTVSPTTTIPSARPTIKTRPNVSNRHDYGWNGAF